MKDFPTNSQEYPFSIGNFRSEVAITIPDADAYFRQKAVRLINAIPKQLQEMKIELPQNSLKGESWKMIYMPLIDLSTRSDDEHKVLYPRTFPGSIIAGPQHTEVHIGSTSWDVFDHMLSIPQRVIDVDKLSWGPQKGYLYNGEKPVLEFSDIPAPQKWSWDISVPKLQQLQLSQVVNDENADALSKKILAIKNVLNNEAMTFWKEFSPNDDNADNFKILKMLSLIQVVQTPFVENKISADAVETAKAILKYYKRAGLEKNVLQMLFQIESSVMYAQTMTQREVIARGFYGHSWLEVAKTNVEDLRSTELVDEKRAIVEIVNLVNRGWAPIIVDERLNNTDGSHRGIAVRVWNLVKSLSDSGIKDFSNLKEQRIQDVVKLFVGSRKDMQGLTLRETLRVTEEFLTNPDFEEHRKIVFDALPNHVHIKYIPTILLREQEACCVVKPPFDKDGKLIGVDPLVTFTLTNGRSDLALGSRGPYHRTDKTPAPWFNIFSLQNI